MAEPTRPSDAWGQPQASPPPPPGSGSPYAPPPTTSTWTPASSAYGPQKTNPLAIVSLVFAIANFVICFFIGAIVAIITGHIASAQIKRSNGTQGGKGLARAGTIVGYVGLALSILGVVGVVVAFTVFGDEIIESELRSDAKAFVENAEREAAFSGTDVRDAETLARAYNATEFDDVFESMILANGASIFSATEADWEASDWRVQLNGESFQEAEICMQIPENPNFDPQISDEACEPVSPS